MNRRLAFTPPSIGILGYSNSRLFRSAPAQNTGKTGKSLFLTLALVLLAAMNSCLMPELSPELLFEDPLNIKAEEVINNSGNGNIYGEEYLRIANLPRNIIYYTGDADPGLTHWERTGLKVTLVGKDGAEKAVALAECAFTPLNMAEAGTKVITVSRDGKTAVFSIAVLDRASVFQEILISRVPNRTTYYRSDDADWTGLEVTEVYYGGDPLYPPNIYTFDYDNPALSFSHIHGELFSGEPGKKTITVAKDGKLAYFDVTITNSLPLEGTVAIMGIAEVWKTLIANIKSLDGSGAISYQWLRGEADIPGATGATYTLVAADLGQTIQVRVSCAENTGTVTGGPTGPVAPYTFITPAEYRDTVNIAGIPVFISSSTASVVFKQYKSVTLSSFNMAKYETTWQLWKEVYDWALSYGYTFANTGVEGHGTTGTGAAGRPELRATRPVSTISWRDAVVWCNAYSEISGKTPVYYTDSTYATVLKVSTNDGGTGTVADRAVMKPGADGYRLPTEAEWEFAARGGDTGVPAWNYTYAGGNTEGALAWFEVNSKNLDLGSNNADYGAHPVGTKAPNSKGLYDLSGNVAEWCWDWHGDIDGAPVTDPAGPASGDYRILRGGSWQNNYQYLNVAFILQSRWRDIPSQSLDGNGFRVVR